MKNEFMGREGNTVTLKITVPVADFAKGIETAYKKNKSKFAVPGFRKGKIPRNMIEKMYGEGVFFEDAINEVLPVAYDGAIDELNIDAIDKPDIDVLEVGKDKDLVIEAKVTVKPEVKLGEYKGINAKKVDANVIDEDVNMEIEKSREMNARMINVEDRAIVDGDTVALDYSGFVGEEQFEGGTAENQTLVIGSGQFIPGFEEQLIGFNINDEKEVKVTFPTEYHAEDLAGKEAVFKVVIKGIKVKELPELDDEFAKDTSEFDTLEELKADIKAKLVEAAEKESETATRDNVIDAVVETLEADIPEVMIEAEIDTMLRDFNYQLSQQGLTLETYVQYTGGSIEDLREQMKEDAASRVKTSIVLEEVAKLENVEVTEEDLETEFARIAEAQNTDVESVKKVFGSDNNEYLKHTVATKKTVDLLVENAKLV
jgi:trigger factor